jgi:hypothetical protein
MGMGMEGARMEGRRDGGMGGGREGIEGRDGMDGGEGIQ